MHLLYYKFVMTTDLSKPDNLFCTPDEQNTYL